MPAPVVILAGGMGTRLQEETTTRPKPMVEIGGKPLVWHIMKHYAHHGAREFQLALGYKGDVIKNYFLDRYNLRGRLTIDFQRHAVQQEDRRTEDWIVHLVDTGIATNTGGRIRRLKPWLDRARFMVTYGDGVSNIDLTALIDFHRSHGRLATITAVRPPARFGGLLIDGDRVTDFTEKPRAGEGWINGGFLVFEPDVFRYLTDDTCGLEADALPRLARDGQLAAYRHEDFWQCMDTLREKNYLESLWRQGTAPWKTWEDAAPSAANKTEARTVQFKAESAA
ncbi:MAG: glucose-1-phosphate cytidylyltransferase [Pirellulales bacterium]